jgi:hypothetical protein
LTSIARSSVEQNLRGGHHRRAVDVPAQDRVRELRDHIRVSAALVNTLDATHVEAIADPAPPWIGDDPNQYATPLAAPLPATMRAQHAKTRVAASSVGDALGGPRSMCRVREPTRTGHRV